MDPTTDARLVYVHALSSLHAGTGQGIGVIDLPIAREKATGIPFLPGSSLKGSLRDLCPELDPKGKNIREKIFGPSSDKNPSEHSGSAQFSDQRLLLLPVRSLVGTFAWVTSPYILKRFVREARLAGVNSFPKIPSLEKETDCVVTNSSCLRAKIKQQKKTPLENNSKEPSIDENKIHEQKVEEVGKVLLEDLDLDPSKKQDEKTNIASTWATTFASQLFGTDEDWLKLFEERFCIVHDDLLSFLLDTATEVSARIVLNDKSKTTENLWYEETLPAETVLYGLIFAKPPLIFKDKNNNGSQKDSVTQPEKLTTSEIFNTLRGLTQKAVQLGGKATVGHGLCSIKMVDICKKINGGTNSNAKT